MKTLFPQMTVLAAIAALVVPHAEARPGAGADEAVLTEGRRMNPDLPAYTGPPLNTEQINLATWERVMAERKDPVLFPIVMTLVDQHGQPVKGAIVALKRLGPDNYSEEEIRKLSMDKPGTDEGGAILLQYPGRPQYGKDGLRQVEMLGAVTILADGYAAQMVELGDYFKEGKLELTKGSAPVLKVKLEE